MRIWLAPSAFFPHRGGVEELTLQLAKELLRQEHDVLVVVHRHPADLPEREIVEGVEIARVNFAAPRRQISTALRFPLAFFGQLHQLRRLGPVPDVVHVQCPSVQLAALFMYSRLSRIPFVITTQGEVVMDESEIFARSAFLRATLRASARHADALTACSEWSGTEAAKIAPAFDGCEVIANGVDPSQWQSTALPEEPIFSAWGRHVPQKGFDLLLEAFNEVRRALPDASLLLGGAGAQTLTLREMAGPGVEMVGSLDRAGVQSLLARSRVVVVPSRLEPFGIVAVEAMAAGRTVVWSNIGGLKDATGGLGWGVDPHNPSALASAMVSAARSPVDPAILRGHAEGLSWARLARRYADVYERVLRP
jgi:glycogen(starch) synthase